MSDSEDFILIELKVKIPTATPLIVDFDEYWIKDGNDDARPSGYAGVLTKIFEKDANGDLRPSGVYTRTSGLWEYDINNDIRLK